MSILYAIGIFYTLVLIGFLITKLPLYKLRAVIFGLSLVAGVSPLIVLGLRSNDLALFYILPVFIFQFVNIFRAVKLRYSERSASRVLTTGMKLGLFLTVVYILDLFNLLTLINLYVYALVTSVMLGVIALVSIKQNISKVTNINYLQDSDLPTVSVLIPARNEDMYLSECIETVLDSDYPKLEVIVLDDCSQDKSSEIIKSFAQKGVRFIQGEVPKDNWLAKNQAYDVLASNASGDWYIFMGVDVRISKKTIRTLMNNVIHNKITMAGVLPAMLSKNPKSLLLPLRFYWESSIPSIIRRFPPTLSTFWVIHDEAFKSQGGFSAVSQSVLPERYFARKLHAKNEYILYGNSKDLSVGTYKSYEGQLSTSVRLLYPQLKKSMFRLLLVTLLLLTQVSMYIFAIYGLITSNYEIFVITSLILLPLVMSHLFVSIYLDIQYKITRALLLPILLVQELIIAFVSAYRYEFSEVIWKGRNVCYPILKVIPKLPKI